MALVVTMDNVSKIEYEWVYIPSTGINVPFRISTDCGNVEFGNGRVVATVDLGRCDWDESLGEYFDGHVRSAIDAISLLEHISLKLDGPSRTDTKKDGTKHCLLNVHDSVSVCTVQSVELVVYDENGKKIADPEADRKEKVLWFAKAFNEYRKTDVCLQKLLDSYYSSIRDPSNEFVHLYEIRDTLSSIFGHKKNAVKELGITNREWDELGELANIKPLEEGRHRGKLVANQELRKASEAELAKGRKSAINLIEKYLVYVGEKNH